MKSADRSLDAIVIGSGVGGLVLAALMAKKDGKRVLVLESHYEVGGFTHRFQRKGYEFDVGVHYVGGLQPGGRFRQIMDYLSEGRLHWDPLPQPEDRLYFSDQEVVLSGDLSQRARKLAEQFPSERAALQKYSRDVPLLARSYMLWQFLESFPALLRGPMRLFLRLFRRAMLQTTASELNRRFKDKKLTSILGAQWPGFGLSPDKSSFGFHCVHCCHYSHGSWYPRGGGERIAAELTRTIEACGGSVRTRAPVARILLQKGRAVGVELTSNERILAPLVISNAGARKTYLELIREPISFRKSLQTSPPGPSAVLIFFALKESPLSLGLDGANHWLIEGDGGDSCLYLSFPSIKRNSSHHTAEVLIPEDSLKWVARDGDYRERKRKLAEVAIESLDFQFPGFREMILFFEVATPLTVRHFAQKPDGAIFGLPASPERLFWPWARSSTPWANLFLTGSDVLASGIGGATHGALKTYDLIQGRVGWRQAARIRRELNLLF